MASNAENSHSSEAGQLGAETQGQDRLQDATREERIRLRAYEIYLARGEEPGNHLEDWRQAERELMDQSEVTGE